MLHARRAGSLWLIAPRSAFAGRRGLSGGLGDFLDNLMGEIEVPDTDWSGIDSASDVFSAIQAGASIPKGLYDTYVAPLTDAEKRAGGLVPNQETAWIPGYASGIRSFVPGKLLELDALIDAGSVTAAADLAASLGRVLTRATIKLVVPAAGSWSGGPVFPPAERKLLVDQLNQRIRRLNIKTVEAGGGKAVVSSPATDSELQRIVETGGMTADDVRKQTLASTEGSGFGIKLSPMVVVILIAAAYLLMKK